MASNNIQITAQVNLDDSQFKNKTQEVLRQLKTITGTRAFIKLKFDKGDIRKDLQAAVANAYRELEKAFGVKKGSPITYGNGKKLNTNKQLDQASDYLSKRINDKSLSTSEHNKAKKMLGALNDYRTAIQQVRDLYRDFRIGYTDSLNGRKSRQERLAESQYREYVRTNRRGEDIKAAREGYDTAVARLQYREFRNKIHRERGSITTKHINQEIQKNQELIASKKALFKLEGRRKSYTDQEVKEAQWRIEALKREKEEVQRNAKAKREQLAFNKAVFNDSVKRRKAEQRAQRQAQRAADARINAQNHIIRQFQQQHGILGGLMSRLQSYFSIYTIISFGKKVAETTGYFEKQQVALEGILGSASKAQSILQQIKDFALQSPFQTSELVGYVKQLSAFSIPDDELFETTKRLADLSAGLGVDMSRIILAYGQVRSASVLRGQELRQFTEAGIPLVKKLADKFTELRGEVVSTADVFDLISKRQVSFQMVSDVLSDMTKEGGQFYKMQENVTNTLYGQIQKMKDMWTIELDKIGKSRGGNFLNSIVQLLQTIIKHTKAVAAGLATAFTLGGAISFVRKLRMEWTLMDVQVKKSIGSLKKFRLIQLKALAGNIGWGALAAGVGIAVGAIIGHLKKLNEVKKQMEEISASFNKETNKMIRGFDDLVLRLRSAEKNTQAYNDALETLKTNYGDYIKVNEETIQTLLNEKKAIEGTVSEYDKLREGLAAAIKLRQKYNELNSKKETADSGIIETAKASWWSGGYDSTVRSVLYNLRSITKGYKGGLNTLFGTNYDGNVLEKLEQDLNGLIEESYSEFTSRNLIDKKDLDEIIKRNLQNSFLDNRLSSLEGYSKDDGKNINTHIDWLLRDAYNALASGSDWEEYKKLATQLQGGGTGLLDAMIRINKEFDNFNPGSNTGTTSIEKRQWIDREYIKILRTVVPTEFKKLADNEQYSNLHNLLFTRNYDTKLVGDINNALKEYSDSIDDSERRQVIIEAANRFKEGTDELTDKEEELAKRIGQDTTWVGKERGKINGVDLQQYIDQYNPVTLGEQTVQQTRDAIKNEYDSLNKELDEYTKNADLFADDISLINAKLAIIRRLAAGDLYAVDLTSKSSGGSNKSNTSGFRRFMTDLFGWLKEARDEEKKLVEFSAGLTEELRNQITSGKLNDTAVNAFWSNTPFKKFIDKMDEYGIESNIMSKEFLNEKLSSIAVKHLETTGTVNWQDIWDELVKIINERANELSSDPNMKSTVDALKNLAASKILEGNKIFSKDKVQSLIEGQLKELRSINAKFNDIKNKREMYDKITGSSNYLLAQRAIYGGEQQPAYFASRTTQSKLRELFSKDYAKGIVKTDAGAAISALLNGGDMNINNLSVLSTLRQQLTEEVNKYQGGTAEQQATFKELNGVIGTFDGLLDQLLKDILDDFEKLMRLKDPITKSSDDIINSYENLKDAQERIAQGVSDGSISGSRAERMRISALQSSYGTIVKGIPQYISNLYGAETASGYTKKGLNFAAALSDNPIITQFAMKQQELLNKELQDIENYYNNPDNLPELTGDARDKEKEKAIQKATDRAANSLQMFSDKLMLASKVLDEVGKYMNAMQSATDQIFNTLEAANRVTVDEYGNYTKQNDYDTARATLNTIYDFGKGVTEGVSAILRGDFTGVFKLFESVMKLIENAMGIGDGLLRKQIEKNNSYIKSLEKSLEKLNHTISEAAGNTKFDNLTEQIEKLREEEAAARENESLERQMKKGDPEAAEAYAEQAEQKAMEVEEIVWRIRDEIFGAADEVASTLTEPLVEAFRNGENAARAWRDSVRGYIGDVLKQILMTNVIGPRIKGILASMGIEEGKTSEKDIMSIMSDPTKMQYLQNSLFAAGDQLIDWFNNGLAEPIKEMIAWNSDTSTLSGGIQGITEDTARTLEGLSYSMLAQMVLIQRGVQSLESSAFAQVQTSWFNDMLTQQRAIRQATESINTAISDMRNGIRPLQVRVS